jgi:predicted kinase
MKELIVLCGPPGSGKSTWAKNFIKHELNSYHYVNQDSHGKDDHKRLFNLALDCGANVIVDRMGFNKEQRQRYLAPAKVLGYRTRIVVLHQPKQVCYDRIIAREGHETIKAGDTATAGKVLHFFFKNYERPTQDEADQIQFVYPGGPKTKAVIFDLDGTLCNIDHRLHYVKGPGKKDWKNFLSNVDKDNVNEWCRQLIKSMDALKYKIVYCSGRGQEYKDKTTKWLGSNELYEYCNEVAKDKNGDYYLKEEHLYMRERGDHRTDYIIKEIILDFELLTRFEILFTVDDRKQVVDMWRRRGITCLHCAEGDF